MEREIIRGITMRRKRKERNFGELQIASLAFISGELFARSLLLVAFTLRNISAAAAGSERTPSRSSKRLGETRLERMNFSKPDSIKRSAKADRSITPHTENRKGAQGHSKRMM